jgi:uncharacterized protein YecE (DUF72 family)
MKNASWEQLWIIQMTRSEAAMKTSHQNMPARERAHFRTVEINTTLYDLIDAISEETTEDRMVCLTVNHVICDGRLKKINH